jgi:large subunit ribosomal protein L22
MEAYALHKMAMVAPRKARMTLDLIRAKDVDTAEAILKNTNTKSSRLIQKVLASAIANAENNLGMKRENLVVSECFINPGPVLKRFKFGSRTKVDRRDKRTSHITIKVKDINTNEEVSN